jgi:hypothetical protein
MTDIQIYEISSLEINLNTDEYKIYPHDRNIIIHSNKAANASIFPRQ